MPLQTLIRKHKKRAILPALAWVILAVLTIYASIPTRAKGEVWYVTTTGDDANDCQTVTAPCATIGAALDKPGFLPGDTILVAEGVFRQAGNEILVLHKNANLSGGWDSSFTTQYGSSNLGGGGGINIEPGVIASISHITVCGYDSDGSILNHGALVLNTSGACSSFSVGLHNLGIARLYNGRFTDGSYTGILNTGVLSMTNVLVSGHSDTGVGNAGLMTITHSTITGQWGWWGCRGIGNGYDGRLTVIDSAIIRNRGAYPGRGGGICNYGTATLINTTVADNTTYGEGELGAGGGIYNAGDLALYNATISNNAGSLGGGIYITGTGTVRMQNTILANNHGYHSQTNDCAGEIQSLGFNLIGDTDGCSVAVSEGDLLNAAAGVLPTGVYPYAPLWLGSPAIDAGDPTGCKDESGTLLAADQRGVTRLGRCDIGAYEYDPAYDPLHYRWMPWVVQSY